MEFFNKRMALEVIEDALTDIDNPHGRGLATGLCGAFHMCGMLSAEEWVEYIQRIPIDAVGGNAGDIHKTFTLQ
jgi:hypothetical protein